MSEEKEKKPMERMAPLFVSGIMTLILSGGCAVISSAVKTTIPKVFLAILGFTGLGGGVIMLVVAAIFLFAIYYSEELR